MFSKTLAFLCLSLPFSVSAQQPAAKTSFDDLLERVKKDDRTINLKELRFAYSETAKYQPYGGDNLARKAMFAALNTKDYEQALQQSEKMLAINFLDINGQFGAFAANKHLGNAEKASYHQYLFQGLLMSISDSGDGKTTGTAFVVISTDEEYSLFNYMGLRVSAQALVEEKGHHFDKMTTVNQETNETGVYYFNIDRPFNWLAKSLK